MSRWPHMVGVHPALFWPTVFVVAATLVYGLLRVSSLAAKHERNRHADILDEYDAWCTTGEGDQQ